MSSDQLKTLFFDYKVTPLSKIEGHKHDEYSSIIFLLDSLDSIGRGLRDRTDDMSEKEKISEVLKLIHLGRLVWGNIEMCDMNKFLLDLLNES